MEILTGAQVRELEPNVVALGALHSPNTGIVDYEVVSLQLAKDIQELGGTIITGFEVNGIKLGVCEQPQPS